MRQVLLVFIGGGLGSVARYLLSLKFNNYENAIPYGTLLANVLGSLFIGIIFDFDPRLSLLAGYAGTDILEGIYKSFSVSKVYVRKGK